MIKILLGVIFSVMFTAHAHAETTEKKYSLFDVLTESRIKNKTSIVEQQIMTARNLTKEQLITYYLLYLNRHDALFIRVRELEAELKKCDSQQSQVLLDEMKN